MAKKTREQLKAASNSTYTTNGAKAITAPLGADLSMWEEIDEIEQTDE